MTAAQRAALEGLVGRELTAEEVEQLEALLDPDNRNDVAIAALLSVGRVKTVITKIGRAAVLDTLGADAGAVVIYGLRDLGKVIPAVGVAYDLLCVNDLDVGNPKTQDKIDDMTGADFNVVTGCIFTPEQAAAIKTLARMPDPIHYNAVSDALNLAEGRMTL